VPTSSLHGEWTGDVCGRIAHRRRRRPAPGDPCCPRLAQRGAPGRLEHQVGPHLPDRPFSKGTPMLPTRARVSRTRLVADGRLSRRDPREPEAAMPPATRPSGLATRRGSASSRRMRAARTSSSTTPASAPAASSRWPRAPGCPTTQRKPLGARRRSTSRCCSGASRARCEPRRRADGRRVGSLTSPGGVRVAGGVAFARGEFPDDRRWCDVCCRWASAERRRGRARPQPAGGVERGAAPESATRGRAPRSGRARADRAALAARSRPPLNPPR
jgi:hypothetical protein